MENHDFILKFSGTHCGEDGGASERDYGKSFQEDKQVPHTPGLQQVGSQLMRTNPEYYFETIICFSFKSYSKSPN